MAWQANNGDEFNRLGVLAIAAALPLFLSFRLEIDDQIQKLQMLEVKELINGRLSIGVTNPRTVQATQKEIDRLKSRVERLRREVILSEMVLVVLGTIQTGLDSKLMEWMG